MGDVNVWLEPLFKVAVLARQEVKRVHRYLISGLGFTSEIEIEGRSPMKAREIIQHAHHTFRRAHEHCGYESYSL